jgi:predicted outer membrane repeat protein
MSLGGIGSRAAVVGLGVLALGVFGVSAASAAPLTVCESGPPTCDYKHIQEAVDAARSGDKIEIAAGTYDGHLEVPGGGTATRLTLQGAGAGQTTIKRSSATISSGVSATITGVTIAGPNPFPHGCCGSNGGIVNRGTLTLNDSTVSGNLASHVEGGGIRNEGGTVTLNNSTVSDNAAGNGNGGGIANEDSGTVTLNNSTVSGNHAGCGGECGGGGILNEPGATMTLNDSAVSGNHADTGPGGGISNGGGTVTLNDSTVSGNTAKTRGGGISNEVGTMTLNRTTVSGNTAGLGGGIFNEAGTVTVNHSPVSGNIAVFLFGGGIANENGGTVTLDHTTVSENTAGKKGGGIFNSGSLTGKKVVITANTAPEGAGIFNEPPGEVNFKNSKVQEP